jgi:hypothetical protein
MPVFIRQGPSRRRPNTRRLALSAILLLSAVGCSGSDHGAKAPANPSARPDPTLRMSTSSNDDYSRPADGGSRP